MKRSRLWSWRRTGIKYQISQFRGDWCLRSSFLEMVKQQPEFKGKGKHGLGIGNHKCRQIFSEESPVDFSKSLLLFIPWQYCPLPLSGNVFSHGIYIMSSDAISMFPLLVVYTKDLEGWTVVMPDTLGHRKTGRRAFQREGTWAKAWGGTRRTNTWVSDS